VTQEDDVRSLPERLTYGNVTATLALFVALGGTSYAVTQLPRISVGGAQIKPSAVGASELRRGSVASRALRNRSVALRDISASARAALKGAKGDPGPPGVAYRAVVNSGGGTIRGNAVATDHQGGSGRYSVAFDRDVSGCAATATLTDAQKGSSACVARASWRSWWPSRTPEPALLRGCRNDGARGTRTPDLLSAMQARLAV
jgi:hypothetical protein